MRTSPEEDPHPHRETSHLGATTRAARTPLPLLPLAVVSIIQFSEPVAATVIYPFINQLVRNTGIIGDDERKTGYFAGVIESLFFLAESVTVYHWGCASDRFGRKPILLLGPIGLSVAMLAFGLSSKFWMLLVSRILQGLSNGNIGVSKTVIAEVTDSTNIADAYALAPAIWSIGATLGPAIGGILAEPSSRWPSLFGKSPFFHQYPYFLPCAAVALISFLSVPMGILGLKETAPITLREKRKSGGTTGRPNSNCGSDDTTSLLNPEGNPVNYNSRRGDVERDNANHTVLHTPNPSNLALCPLILYVCGFRSFIDMCVTVLRPLVWSTSIHHGGLGFSPYEIGLIMGIWGTLNICFQVVLLGPMIRRIGPKAMVVFAFAGYTVTFMLYPLLTFFVRSAGKVNGKAWFVLAIQLTLSIISNGAYAGFQVIVVENTPKKCLGAANGLVQAITSGAEALAPTTASSLFSFSLQRRLLGGNLVFCLLCGVALAGLRLVVLLPRANNTRTH